jgi:hypothetical protein
MNKTKSTASIKLTSSVKVIRICPRPEIAPNIKSIAFDLVPQQAAKLALLLAAAAQQPGWERIAVTGFRDRATRSPFAAPQRKTKNETRRHKEIHLDRHCGQYPATLYPNNAASGRPVSPRTRHQIRHCYRQGLDISNGTRTRNAHPSTKTNTSARDRIFH